MYLQIPEKFEYATLMPEISLTLTGLVVMMYDAFAPKENKRDVAWIALTGIAAAGISLVRLWGIEVPPAFHGMVLTDPLRLFFDAIFLIAAAVTVLTTMQSLDDERLPPGEFYSLLLFGTVGMLLMGAAGDLALLFLGLETLSITTYVLAGYRRGDVRANESALKYFILGSFSTGFLLYGIALTYGATKTMNLAKIQEVVTSGAVLSMPLLTVGVVMMLIGLCFKVATAPFHVWAPDVYQGAPTPVTGFMASGPKAAAFAAFLRIFVIIFPLGMAAKGGWVSIISVIAILSMTLGNIVAVAQTNIKRMLAYSSVAHAGYAMIGILANDWSAVAFYMLSYSLMTLGAFTVITLLARQGDEKTELEDYAGIGFKSVGLSVVLMVFMLSLGGIPLTAGFMGKLVIFKQAWMAGHKFVVLVAVVNSAISFYYYLRPLVVMFFRERETEYVAPRIPAPVYMALTLTLIGVFYLGMFPGQVLGLLDGASSGTSPKVPVTNTSQRVFQ